MLKIGTNFKTNSLCTDIWNPVQVYQMNNSSFCYFCTWSRCVFLNSKGWTWHLCLPFRANRFSPFSHFQYSHPPLILPSDPVSFSKIPVSPPGYISFQHARFFFTLRFLSSSTAFQSSLYFRISAYILIFIFLCAILSSSQLLSLACFSFLPPLSTPVSLNKITSL